MVKRILGIGLALTFCGLAAAGCAKGDSGNPGFMVVNYNDTSRNKKVNAKMDFGDYTQAQVYRKGKKTVVDLKDGMLDVALDVGEGVFVIPCS